VNAKRWEGRPKGSKPENLLVQTSIRKLSGKKAEEVLLLFVFSQFSFTVEGLIVKQ